jgi:GntR family galactonate operon transcriptional repressor
MYLLLDRRAERRRGFGDRNFSLTRPTALDGFLAPRWIAARGVAISVNGKPPSDDLKGTLLFRRFVLQRSPVGSIRSENRLNDRKVMARIPNPSKTREKSWSRPVSNPLPAIRALRGGRDQAAFERNIPSQLAGQLGRDIVGGVYPPGSLLPNAIEMGERFSVSRTALREAYSMLSAKALIVARPKVGTRVRPKSEWNMLDPEVLAWHLEAAPTEEFINHLFVLRQMVEPPAAALAAAAGSSATVERVADAYRRMERFQNGTGDLIGADLDFHTGILEATQNPFLAALAGLILASLECTFRLSWQGAARIHHDRLLQHHAILEAIRKGAPELARDRMAELLQDSAEDVRTQLRVQGSMRPKIPAAPKRAASR